MKLNIQGLFHDYCLIRNENGHDSFSRVFHVPLMVKKEVTSYYLSVAYSVSKSFQSETTEQLRIKPSLFSTYLFVYSIWKC